MAKDGYLYCASVFCDAIRWDPSRTPAELRREALLIEKVSR